MPYAGNLTCGDCGLTFTARWGSVQGADEYRCERDHVVRVVPATGEILSIDGVSITGATLVDVRGRCPHCATELAFGLLPACPVCGSRDHEIALSG